MLITNVYIASSFSLENKILSLVKRLEEMKIDITCKWWDKQQLDDLKHNIKLDDDEFFNHSLIKQTFYRDFNGIKNADTVILVCPSGKAKSFNGANIEIGIAYGLEKLILSVGKLDRNAMNLVINQRFERIDYLVEWIDINNLEILKYRIGE